MKAFINILYQEPVNYIISIILSAIALYSLRYFILNIVKAYKTEGYSSAYNLLNAHHGLLYFLIGIVWALGIYFANTAMLIIGLVLVCQESYEGAVLKDILKKELIEPQD